MSSFVPFIEGLPASSFNEVQKITFAASTREFGFYVDTQPNSSWERVTVRADSEDVEMVQEKVIQICNCGNLKNLIIRPGPLKKAYYIISNPRIIYSNITELSLSIPEDSLYKISKLAISKISRIEVNAKGGAEYKDHGSKSCEWLPVVVKCSKFKTFCHGYISFFVKLRTVEAFRSQDIPLKVWAHDLDWKSRKAFFAVFTRGKYFGTYSAYLKHVNGYGDQVCSMADVFGYLQTARRLLDLGMTP